MHITNIILDFDGTCTDIAAIYEPFLAQFFTELNKAVFANAPLQVYEWQKAQGLVRMHSPQAAWTFSGTAAAPAAADPYILAFECAKYLLRKEKITKDVPPEVFGNAATAHPAPFRNEVRNIIEKLLTHNIKINFISNTSSVIITERLKSLFSTTELPTGISVKSDAEKYLINELVWDSTIPINTKKLFQQLPAVHTSLPINRPVYLRRGAYFEAICKTFDNDLGQMPNTVFCGDIWEMDLAMPYALGANIHLIERATPFDTYPYERNEVLSSGNRGKISEDLTGLLKWIQ